MAAPPDWWKRYYQGGTGWEGPDATVNPPTAAFHTTRIIEELDEKRST
jgi:hypothetical protein